MLISFFGILYSGLQNFVYLVSSHHPLEKKIRIFLTWLRINLKFILIGNLFNLQSENIFGYKINTFSYGSLRFLFEEIFYRNEYLFKSNCNQPIIFDCGANIGLATIFFKWLYPESEIYAFEPDADTFALLKKNIAQNKVKKVHLFNAALSDVNGKIDFFIDTKNPGSLVMSSKPARMPKDKVMVDCISLSSFIQEKKIQHIDFLKMDIEGSEEEVIQDLSQKDQLKKVDKLVIEYHHKISGYKSNLGSFLLSLEKNGFEYQINSKCFPISSENKFQDILLYLYKPLVVSKK